MSARITTQQKWYLASLALNDAYTDFILSRQAMQCKPATFEFYRYTTGVFLTWAEGQNVNAPEQIDARLIRYYLADLVSKGKSDKTVNANARAITIRCR